MQRPEPGWHTAGGNNAVWFTFVSNRPDLVFACLELLADQVDLVLDEMPYPAQRTGHASAAGHDATAELTQEVGGSAFRVTLEQIDCLSRLIEAALAHARVVAVGDTTERAAQALPAIGDTLCDAVDEMRALLRQIERQPL
ncbi:hypothetical protein HF319_05130, partial [Xanthomonas sp. Kuri4-1]